MLIGLLGHCRGALTKWCSWDWQSMS